ncbi:MAG: hypothetical protein PHX02_00650 [Oscillospiraceae bacterium]|nr:hypothetical protein [Oscillospiraceae bacterium]
MGLIDKFGQLIKPTANVGGRDKESFFIKMLRFFCMALSVSLILELIIFNYASYILITGEYYEKSFLIDSVSGLKPLEGKPDYFIATSQRPVIELKNINMPVRTLYVDASSEKLDRYELVINLEYTDSTCSYPEFSPKKMRLVPGMERTKYTVCHYNGNAGKIRMALEVDRGEVLHLGRVLVNSQIPYVISWARIFILALISLAVYTLVKAPFMRAAYGGKSKRAASVSGSVVFIVFIVVIIGTYVLYTGTQDNPFKQETGDQISQELVDAFKNRQVSLLETPSKQLLEMDNPYDWGARESNNVDYKWDHLLYNGKYYSYYGIAPVLLLFLPYNLITGYYLASHIACLLFALLGAYFLSAAYFKMIDNWFKKTPLGIVLCGQVILLMSCGILFCLCRPMFYEVSEAAGFMFFAGGIYALFSSNILTNKKVRLLPIALSSLCVALAVLSRPTFALYAIAMLFWFGYGFVQYKKHRSKKIDAVRYFVAALLPLIIFGILQMAYNYARFGSVFDFGIQYSLTINDFTRTDFFMHMAFVSMWNFLFAFPVIKSDFPFFTSHLENWGLNGFFFFETGNAFGLVWRALPMLSFGYTPRLLRRAKSAQRLKMLLLCGISGFAVPLLLIISTWESGYALRYNVDFAWQMLLTALAISFFVYNRIKSESLRRVLYTIMIGCALFSVISNLSLLLLHIPGVGNTIFVNREKTLFYYRMARTLEFWN